MVDPAHTSHVHHDHAHHERHEHHTHDHGAAVPTETTAFVVTINPEARVDVRRTDKIIGPFTAGEWIVVPVLIANEGFVTGPLQILSTPVDGVEVDAPLTELTGGPTQETAFRIRFLEPVDLSQYDPEDADDIALVGRLSERIRLRIQEELDDLVLTRKSVWFG